MKTRQHGVPKMAAWPLLAVLAGGLLAAGCDETMTDNNITINPPTANMERGSDPILFGVTVETNKALYMPLEWTVSDPSLGSIIMSKGFSAVYSRTSKSGHNTIIVQDQGQHEGLASVVQQ